MRGVLIAALVLASSVAAAQEQRFSTFAAAGAWSDRTSPAHGVIMAAWDLSRGDEGRIAAVFNTDTLRLTYDGLPLTDRLHLGGRLTGELFVANLLTDYHLQGENVPARAFRASYAEAEIWVKYNPVSSLYVQPQLAVRRWAFSPGADTAPALVLPPDAWSLKPRLSVTWWRLRDDAGWRDRHRVFPRLRGWAAGATVGMNLRDTVRPWGARDPGAFSPPDPRNNPAAAQYHATHWLKAGWQAAPFLRLQWAQEVSEMRGGDDLTRRQIGGLNPYAVTVPGVPWAYFMAGDYAAGQASIHGAVWGNLEAGLLAGGVALRDADRTGSRQWDGVWGAGAFLDWRRGPWQFDLRGGYAPGLARLHPGQAAWSTFALVGWATP